jgi:uncharacterized membrane protein YdjX (TVP38/TMEM64 family)
MNVNEGTPRRPPLRRAWLLLPVCAAFVAFFAFGLNRYVTLEALHDHREWLLAEVQRLGVLAPLLFIAVYATLVGSSIPGATVLTVTGGFLFGTLVGAASSVIGATLGATIIFLIARSAVGDALRARAGKAIERLEHGLRRDPLSYLLFLRLMPPFPFFIVNLVPAFLGVSLRDFFIATALGIIPGGLVYASFGSGLGEVFARGGSADLRSVGADPKVWLPMVALGLLALAPVAYKRWWRRGTAS